MLKIKYPGVFGDDVCIHSVPIEMLSPGDFFQSIISRNEVSGCYLVLENPKHTNVLFMDTETFKTDTTHRRTEVVVFEPDNETEIRCIPFLV